MAEMTLYEPWELVGMNGIKLIAPEFRSKVRRNVRSGYEKSYEVVGVRKDGSTYPLEVQGKAIPYEGRNVRITEFRDISERKKTVELLKESQEKYLNIFDNATEGIYQSTPEGKFVYMNPSLARMLGYESPRECIRAVSHIGKQVYARPEDRDDYTHVLDREGSHTFELQVHTKDGSIKWMSNSMKAIRNEAGEVILYEGFVQDITRRKQAEEAFYKCFYSNPCMMTISSPDGRIMDVNESFLRATGFSQDEAVGNTFVDLGMIDPWTFRVMEQALAEQGHIYAMEHNCTTKTGEAATHLFSAEMLEIGETVRILGTAQDITSRKQLEGELTKMKNLESIGTLAGGIAHDFNNLLMAVTGYISLAKIFLTSDSEGYGFLADAERISLAGKELTQKLITFSKGGASVRNVLDLAPLIEHSSRIALADSDIRCSYSIRNALFPVYADPLQIDQVIQIILTNSKEAMPGGGSARIMASNVSPSREKAIAGALVDHVKITIEDEGRGIREEDLPRIFDPYFTTKDLGAERGMGMGLAVAYSIIKRHNGVIKVESKPGKGTKVHIYLPAHGTDARAALEDAPSSADGQGRILYMDDDDNVRNVGRRFISFLGYEVTTAESGSQAVSLYKEALDKGKPFHAVILDLTVKGDVGGKEAFDLILASDPGAKGIISSGYTDDPIMSNYGEYGFSAAIAKPYEVDELKRTLESIMGKNPGDAPYGSRS